jgi:hypothetical protein
MQYGGHVTEDDLEATRFNPVSWTDVQLLRWIQNLHQSTWYREMLYTDGSWKNEQHLMRRFLWTQ